MFKNVILDRHWPGKWTIDGAYLKMSNKVHLALGRREEAGNFYKCFNVNGEMFKRYFLTSYLLFFFISPVVIALV